MSEENLTTEPQLGVPLKRYAGILFRYKVIIASIFVAGTTCGILSAAFFIRPMRVWDGKKVVRVRSPWNEMETLTGDPESAPGRGGFFVEAEIEKFYDNLVLGQVVDQCNLLSQQKELHAEFKKSAHGQFRRWLADNIPFLFGSEPPSDAQYREGAIQLLAKSLTLESSPLSRRTSPVLIIKYYNPLRERVPQVIDSLVNVYRKEKKEEFAEGPSSMKQRQLFRQRFKQLENKYNKKREELQREYDKLSLPFDADFTFLLTYRQQHVLQVEGQLKYTTNEIQKTKAQIVQLEAQYKAIMEAGSKSYLADTPEFQQILDRYESYGKRITELEVLLSSPGVSRTDRRKYESELNKMRSETVELGRQIKALRDKGELKPPEAVRIETDLAMYKAAYDELESQEKELSDELDEKQEKLDLFQTSIARLTVLREEFHRIRDRYEEEEIRKDDREIFAVARQQVDYLEEVTKVVKMEDEPRKLHKLSRSLLILTATLGSLVLGCAIAFLFGMVLDTSLHSTIETEKNLGVPVLAVVPEVRRSLWG